MLSGQRWEKHLEQRHKEKAILKELWIDLLAMTPREDSGSPTVCPQYLQQGQSHS